ncbi:hypothetical protein LIER_41627 [Lithospermum erythrorhizon]|uniref:Uncharacterized protein n=1 Tax=Lithospermum erythrorhizon TaxID=34254 RepID=A0AAV3RFI5_LITER
MGSKEEAIMVELVTALEKASLMTKHLPNTTDPSQIHQIYASLHAAHHHLTMFLHNQSTPFPYGGDETMEVADDEVETEQSWKSLDGVQERLKDWSFVQNKRPKRLLSPSAAEQLRNEVVGGGGGDGEEVEFDPHLKKLRALDLIYQFHS